MAEKILLLKVIAAITICGGWISDFIKSLDKNPSQQAKVEYPFSLSFVQSEKLMHKPNFSVMGWIDMFCKLRTLLVTLSGLLDERCVHSTQFLKNVGICCVD